MQSATTARSKDTTTQNLMMDPSEAARISGLSARSITRLCNSGAIKAVRLGKLWRINRRAFMAQLGIAE